MTIQSVTIRTVPLEGDGANKTFNFGFLINAESELKVVHTASGVETEITSNFTVSGVGNPSGGSINYPDTGDAIPAGEYITMIADVEATQETNFTLSGGYSPTLVMAALDKLTRLIQLVDEKADRALRLPLSADGFSLELPVPVAGYLIGWDANGLASIAKTESIVYVGSSAPDPSNYPLWLDSGTGNFNFWDGAAWQSTSGTDITGKADKVVGGTEGALFEQDADGNLVDTGVPISALATVAAVTASLAGKSDTGHTHDAAAIVSGIIAAARLGSGTPSSSKYLRGDGVWETPPDTDTDTHASTDFGGLGSYVRAAVNGSTVASGATTPASNLTGVSSGTWRNMETVSIPNGTSGIFVRIS